MPVPKTTQNCKVSEDARGVFSPQTLAIAIKKENHNTTSTETKLNQGKRT